MSSPVSSSPVSAAPTVDRVELTEISTQAVATVRRWLTEAAAMPVDAAGERLAGVLKDPDGLDFTVGFVDGVIRPEDPAVRAARFAELAGRVPRFVPPHLRAGMRLGGLAGRVVPGAVMPVVTRAMREMVGHLLIDATDAKLGPAIERIKKGPDGQGGRRLNINLLGEAVLGSAEAEKRLEGTRRLLARDDVDYVSIKVSATVEPHSPWAFDEAVADVVESLSPLYRQAAEAPTPKFINLDMEEYRDLDLTTAVFTRILDQPEFAGLGAGIVLQAYLPDALGAMMGLQEWAAQRVAAGGAPIKVRLVKGANLPMERVEASLHDWPVATCASKQDSDTNYKRVLNWALTPERVAHVRLGVAGHNLFDVAFAWHLAQRRGASEGMEVEMLLGMAQQQAAAVSRDVGGLLLYTPVVHPEEFDVAIAYLIRRLEEGASQENFMSAVFDLADHEELFERERQRFLASVAALDDSVPAPRRTQDRRTEALTEPQEMFANTPDTDPALPGNRAWGRAILERLPDSDIAEDIVAAHTITTHDEVEHALTSAVEASRAWGERTGAERAAVLREVALELGRRRAELLEVAAVECGKTLDQTDPEVSEAIDFANYYAELAEGLDEIDGAIAVPVGLTVVTPPWNFPVAIAAGSSLAPLAAGSAVIIKPAPQARRCGALVAQCLWDAGVPREVAQLVVVEDGDVSTALVADDRVDRLILTGAYETAELFRTFRPDLPLLAETSGKNSIIVTPSADIDLAVKDVVQSAFGHAGQKCSAASLVILVGSVARSERFRRQLVDAVHSLRVGRPWEATTTMGPIIEPASGKLLDGLTTLGEGESWLVEPRQLDDEGTLWTPGVRDRVAPMSTYHQTEYFGPILGIMTAATLEEAITLQNQVEYGLTAGLHSLERAEIETWLERAEAGNLYVNRGITGAIVRRQPFGGWKKSAVGAGTKAGGPNYLIGLSDFEPAPARRAARSGALLSEPVRLLVQACRDAAMAPEDLAFLTRSFASDAVAWRDEFGVAKDVSGLAAEHDVFRYRAVPVSVRWGSDSTLVELIRVLGAALLTSSPLRVSIATDVPSWLKARLAAEALPLPTETTEEWYRVAATLPAGRVRLLGESASELYRSLGGRPDLAVYDHAVTEAGRVEVLPFLREQAVSLTAHRFGTPTRLTAGLF